jgi:large subunit ribosomal protein L32e
MVESTSATTESALKLRGRLKGKKPDFVRNEGWRYKRLKGKWRKPRGIDNKMRKKVKGWPVCAKVGYKRPKASRGLHPSGYKEVLVHNVEELKGIDPERQAARLAHAVGKRERARILIEARKKKITVLNFKETKEAAEKESPEEKGKGEPEKEEKLGEEEAGIEEPEEEQEKPKKGKGKRETQ